MSIKASVDELLEKPMDRKEFLVNTGAALLTLMGVSAVLKSFGAQEARRGQGSGSGYGGGAYGR